MSKIKSHSRSIFLVVPALAILFILGFSAFNKAFSGPSDESLTVLTETDFSEDHALFAVADENIVAVFLESPSAEVENSDTGGIGYDLIPYRYRKSMKQTFCWQDADEGAGHYMSLLDTEGNEVLKVAANGDCVTRVIEPGDYEMRLYHDGRTDKRVAVFIVTEENKSTLSTTSEEALSNVATFLDTNRCAGCDLSGVNLFKADLSGVDLSDAILNDAILTEANLSDADLSGAELKNADLSQADLTGADLTGADLSGAILINADLSDANLLQANLENADTTGAIFNNTVLSGTGQLIADGVGISADQTAVRQDEDPCPDEGGRPKLLPGDGTKDLVISKKCEVVAGIYQYKNVNIKNNGVLEFKDEGGETHFWAKSILVENNGSLIAGTDSDTGAFGVNGGTLTIHLYWTKTDGSLDRAGIECQTDAICGIPEGVWSSNPEPTKATDFKATCNKTPDLPGNVEDCFYKYLSERNDKIEETGFFGRKVLAVSYNGTIRLFGKKGAKYGNVDNWDSGMSWVRLRNDKDAKPEKTLINLDRDVDWEEGDRIVITTTDYLPGHSEELQIANVLGPRKLRVTKIDPKTNKPPDGCDVMKPDNDKCGLRYLHNGDLYPDEDFNFKSERFKRLNLDIEIRNGGVDNRKNLAETRAAVALLTRSIRIVSGGNNGIPEDETGRKCKYDCFPIIVVDGKPIKEGFFGGQTMFRQGFQEVKVQGVEFYQLGQGGQMGRYPVHFHLARKTPLDTYLKDNSVHDSMTRWYTIHGTHDVMLARNVGYKSIGHGYYIEDGTEIGNKFYSNIGIFARAGIENEQNPRNVPGILAQPREKDGKQVAVPPFNSDFANPTVFWIMNGWNDFEYNMAVGAGTCGACYWLLPARISGISKNMVWESYASSQKLFVGRSPLKTFRGNYCSTAQISFNTVEATDACNGIGDLKPVINTKIPSDTKDFFPDIAGVRNPTLCNGTCSNNTAEPCREDSECGGNEDTCTKNCADIRGCEAGNFGAPFDDRKQCPVTVIDRYTSAFHWPEKNFAAIWLRGKWMLFSNSVLSDSQNGGLGLVTGGDYTLSNVPPGNWQIATKSVFIGNAQRDNTLASNAGPFVPGGLECDNMENRTSYCLSKKEGVTFPISNFSMQQRLFNVYDGPNAQDSNLYMDITTTPLGGHCKPGGGGNCPSIGPWMYTGALGIPIDVNKDSKKFNQCVLPNAAIGWKQPNGFYYPPAFHSRNLLFENVDIRHLVIEPLWKPNTFESDLEQIKINYCTFDPTTEKNQTFTGFTAVDRQTVLNDDDGSLTGLLSYDGSLPRPSPAGETISVNLTEFFVAPSEAPECRSFDIAKLSSTMPMPTTGGTAKTSPYEYLTTALYPACAVKTSEGIRDCGGHCTADNERCAGNSDCPGDKNTCEGSKWGEECTSEKCYGVNLTRQLFTPQEAGLNAEHRTIQMMGMSFWQRSMLTLNNNAYYIDTTLSEEKQKEGRGGSIAIEDLNVFEPNGTYYIFFLYATERTKQEYQIFIGEGITDFEANMEKYIRPVRVNIKDQALKFEEGENVVWSGLNPSYDAMSGIMTVKTDFKEFESQFKIAEENYCQPDSFCKFEKGSCVSSLSEDDPLRGLSQQICETWASKDLDIDCPFFKFQGDAREQPGCIGFAVTLGDSEKFKADNRPVPNADPYVLCFPNNEPWNNVVLIDAGNIAGEGCKNQNIPAPQFCQ